MRAKKSNYDSLNPLAKQLGERGEKKRETMREKEEKKTDKEGERKS